MGLETYSISSLSSLRTFLSCIMYSVMELKYFRALWMSLEPLSRSRALFRITLSLGVGWKCYLRGKHDHYSLPLSVELVSLTFVDVEELFLQVGRQVDGGIKILPVGRVQF